METQCCHCYAPIIKVLTTWGLGDHAATQQLDSCNHWKMKQNLPPPWATEIHLAEMEKCRVLVVDGTGFIRRQVMTANLVQDHPAYILMWPEIRLDIRQAPKAAVLQCTGSPAHGGVAGQPHEPCHHHEAKWTQSCQPCPGAQPPAAQAYGGNQESWQSMRLSMDQCK